MRELADSTRIERFMQALGQAAQEEGRVYLTGGATAVLQDLGDVREMIAAGLVDPADARAKFEEIESQLYRFPAIDPVAFRRSVDELFG